MESGHREVPESVLLTGGVDRDDVRMVETGQRAVLAVETVQDVGIGGEAELDRLDRHDPREPVLLGLVEPSHAADGQQSSDLVHAQPLGDSQAAKAPVSLHQRRGSPRRTGVEVQPLRLEVLNLDLGLGLVQIPEELAQDRVMAFRLLRRERRTGHNSSTPVSPWMGLISFSRSLCRAR